MYCSLRLAGRHCVRNDNIRVVPTAILLVVRLLRVLARRWTMAQPGAILLGLRVEMVVLVHALNRINETETQSLAFNLIVREERQVLGGLDVGNVLSGALGEDDVNLLERPFGGFRVEKVDDGEEAGVDDGEEEVGSPANPVDPVFLKLLVSIFICLLTISNLIP